MNLKRFPQLFVSFCCLVLFLVTFSIDCTLAVNVVYTSAHCHLRSVFLDSYENGKQFLLQ